MHLSQLELIGVVQDTGDKRGNSSSVMCKETWSQGFVINSVSLICFQICFIIIGHQNTWSLMFNTQFVMHFSPGLDCCFSHNNAKMCWHFKCFLLLLSWIILFYVFSTIILLKAVRALLLLYMINAMRLRQTVMREFCWVVGDSALM